MIAASATARSPSVISRSLGRSCRSVPSSVRRVSPSVCAANDDAAAGQLRAVEGVERAPPDVHDVVRHVDDVRDRPHAREVEPAAEPLGRRPDADVAEHAADVARAALEVLDPDVDGLGGCVTGGSSGSGSRSSPSQSAATSRAIPTIESRSGRFIVGAASSTWSTSGQDVGEGRPGLEPVREQHDPVVVGAEADLVLGEDHPLRYLASERPLLERAREPGSSAPGKPDRDGRPRAEVPRAADDLLRVGVADVDLAELQPVGVRVRLGRDHAPDDEVAEVAALVGDADLRSPARPPARR